MPVDTIKIVSDNPNRMPIILAIFAVSYLIYTLVFMQINNARKRKLVDLRRKIEERHSMAMLDQATRRGEED